MSKKYLVKIIQASREENRQAYVASGLSYSENDSWLPKAPLLH